MTSTKIEVLLGSFDKNAALHFNLQVYDKLQKEMDKRKQITDINDNIQKELITRIKLDVTSENEELRKAAIETWTLLLKHIKCIDDDFINVVYGSEEHDLKCIASLYSLLIKQNCLDFSKLLMISVNMDVCKKILNSILQSSADIPHNVFFNFMTEKVLNLIFKTNDSNLRKVLIEFVLSIKDKYPIPIGKYKSIGSFFRTSYLLDVEALRRKNNTDWYHLCIFIMEFCGTLLHSEIELTNAILHNIEVGFKTRTVEDRLASYECWKVLIDNCSLDRNYLCSNKQLRLLVKPLTIKLSKHEYVIAKRLAVWAHLIQALQKHAIVCLGDFLQYCYGPIKSNTIDELVPITSDVVKNTWRLRTDILMKIIGHYGHVKSCISGSNFELEEPLISGSNFMEFDYLILNSVRVCCERILLWENKNSRPEKIKCLWGSLFDIVQNVEDKHKEDVINKVFAQISYLLDKSFSKIDYFEDLLKNIFEVLSSFEKPICDTVLLNQIIIFPILKSMISCHDISEERINSLINVAKYTGKFCNKLDYFNDACVFFNSCDHKINDCMLSLELWLHFADVLYAVCKTPRDSVEAFEGNAKFLMSWIFRYIFPSYLNNKIMDKWKDVLLELSAISPYCKEQLLREYEKVIKENPNLIPNIVAFLPIFTQFGLDENFNKTCVTSLVSLTLECLKHPFVSKQKISLLIPIVKNYMELCVKLDNSDIELVSEKLMHCFVHLLHPHQAYEILNSVKVYLSKIPENIREKVPSSLFMILNELVTNSDLTISNAAVSVLKELGKETKPERCTFVQPVVSSRTARIANMAKRAAIVSPTTSFLKVFGKDIDPATPTRLKGSQINSTPSPRAKKIYAQSRISKCTKGIDEDDSKEFVLIEKEVKLNKSKMNKHQKEMLKKRREDIPALYQDLSQSQHSNTLDNSMDNRSISVDNEAFENINDIKKSCTRLEEKISTACKKSSTNGIEPNDTTNNYNHSDVETSCFVTVDESVPKEIKRTSVKLKDQIQVTEQNKCQKITEGVNLIKYVLSDQHNDKDNFIHNKNSPRDNKIKNIVTNTSSIMPENELSGVKKSFTDHVDITTNSPKYALKITQNETHFEQQNSYDAQETSEKIDSITCKSDCDKNITLLSAFNNSETDIKLKVDDKLITIQSDKSLGDNVLLTPNCNESELKENEVSELLKDNDNVQIDESRLLESTMDDVFSEDLSKSMKESILSNDILPNENLQTSANCLTTSNATNSTEYLPNITAVDQILKINDIHNKHDQTDTLTNSVMSNINSIKDSSNLKRKHRTKLLLCTGEDRLQQVNLIHTRSVVKLNMEQHVGRKTRRSNTQAPPKKHNVHGNESPSKPQLKRFKKLQLKGCGHKIEKDSDCSKIDSIVYTDPFGNIQKNSSATSSFINGDPSIEKHSDDCKVKDSDENINMTSNINEHMTSLSTVSETKCYKMLEDCTYKVTKETGYCKIDEANKCADSSNIMEYNFKIRENECLEKIICHVSSGSLDTSVVDNFDGDIIKQLEAEISKIDENLHGDLPKPIPVKTAIGKDDTTHKLQFRVENNLSDQNINDLKNGICENQEVLLSKISEYDVKVNVDETLNNSDNMQENKPYHKVTDIGNTCSTTNCDTKYEEMIDVSKMDVPKNDKFITANEQNVTKDVINYSTFSIEETDSNSSGTFSDKKLKNELKRIQMDIVGADLFVRSSRKRQACKRKYYSLGRKKETKLETEKPVNDKFKMIPTFFVGDKLENGELSSNSLACNESEKSINNDTVSMTNSQFQTMSIKSDQESSDGNLSLQSKQQSILNPQKEVTGLDESNKKGNDEITRRSSVRLKTPDFVNKRKKSTLTDKQITDKHLETSRKSKRRSIKNNPCPENVELQQTKPLEVNSEDIVESSQEIFKNNISRKSDCTSSKKTDSPKRYNELRNKLPKNKTEHLNSNIKEIVQDIVEKSSIEQDGYINANNDVGQDTNNLKLNENVSVVKDNETMIENMGKTTANQGKTTIASGSLESNMEKSKINLLNTYSENLFDSPNSSPESNQNCNKIAIVQSTSRETIDFANKDNSTDKNTENKEETNDALTETCNPDQTVSLDICNPNDDLININSVARPGLFGNINIDSLPIGFDTPKKQNLPTSPICDDTPDRNSELLCNTLDISPIKINDVKDNDVIVLDLEETTCKNLPTEYVYDATERLVHKNITTIISDCLSANQKSSIKKPSSRSAKLLNLLPKSTFHLKSSNQIVKKSCTTRISSPTTDRIRKMMLNCGEKVKIPSINYDDDIEIAESDVLSFSRSIPSPLATPNSGILKRKASEVIDEECYPYPKRKRVNFSDPPTSCKKIYFKEQEEYKQNFKKSFKKISLKIDSKTVDKEVRESEESSCSLISGLHFMKAECIYPQLINCNMNINAIQKFSNAEDLIQNFHSIDVMTIGDLAKLNTTQVNQLEFLESPKLIGIMDALDTFYMSYKEGACNMLTLAKDGQIIKGEADRFAPNIDTPKHQIPIFPELVECNDTIQNILKLIGNTKTAKDFRKKNITTVGHLAKLSRQDVCQLHVKLPKVTYVLNALNKYHRKLKNKKVIAQQMNEELVEEIRSMIEVHDAKNASMMTSINDDEIKQSDKTVIEISDEDTHKVHEKLCFTPKRNHVGVVQNLLSDKIDETILSFINYPLAEIQSSNVIDICTQEEDVGSKLHEVPSTDVSELKIQDNIFVKKYSRTELVDYVRRQYTIEEVKEIYEDLGRIIGNE